MRAAELIAAKPVVVLSGKGGCGKTEVVGTVFSYAQRALAQERLVLHVTAEACIVLSVTDGWNVQGGVIGH